MSLSYSKKNKCQGCTALCPTKTNYSCSLGFKLTFEMNDGIPWMPKPEEKCYKPKSLEQLREARKELKKKVTV